jgi:hypothetical protein
MKRLERRVIRESVINLAKGWKGEYLDWISDASPLIAWCFLQYLYWLMGTFEKSLVEIGGEKWHYRFGSDSLSDYGFRGYRLDKGGELMEIDVSLRLNPKQETIDLRIYRLNSSAYPTLHMCCQYPPLFKLKYG